MSLPALVAETRLTFLDKFGSYPVIMAHTPGRLNICGEHTDYNGGLALPMALNRYAVVGVKPSNSDRVRAHSVALREKYEWSLNHPRNDLPAWANYINGALLQFSRDFGLRGGVDIVVHSDLSIGTGLGSSAAFGVSIALALQILSPQKIRLTDLPVYCQRMENQFMGVETGVLDQTIAIFAREGYALRIDFSTGNRTLEPLRMPNHQFVVMESGESRQLAKSGYNERVAWGQNALAKARERFGSVKNLAALNPEQVTVLKAGLSPAEFGVARHVVSENLRVDQCAQALVKGDMDRLGNILVTGHASMRDDLKASSERLDYLVSAALEQKGCLGARIVGGGFGGSGFALVETAAVGNFCSSMGKIFKAKYHANLTIYPVASNDSASVWRVYD